MKISTLKKYGLGMIFALSLAACSGSTGTSSDTGDTGDTGGTTGDTSGDGGGTTDGSGSTSGGDTAGGSTAALTTSNMSLVASSVILAPDANTGTTTVTGNAGAITAADGSSVDCSNATVTFTSGGQSSSATLDSDCSFTVTVTTTTGSTGELKISDSSAASSAGYPMTIPAETTSYQNSITQTGNIATFTVSQANTTYTVCPVTDPSTCSSADAQGCFTVTSDADATVSVLVESGVTLQILDTDPATGETTCQSTTQASAEEQAQAEAEFNAAEAEYTAVDSDEVTSDDTATQTVTASSKALTTTTKSAEAETDPKGFNIKVLFKLRATMPDGQELMLAIPACGPGPCQGDTIGYTTFSSVDNKLLFYPESLLAESGGIGEPYDAKVTTKMKSVNHDGGGGCSIKSGSVKSDPDPHAYKIFVKAYKNLQFFNKGSLLTYGDAFRVEVAPMWTERWDVMATFICPPSFELIDQGPGTAQQALLVPSQLFGVLEGVPEKVLFSAFVPSDKDDHSVSSTKYTGDIPVQENPYAIVNGQVQATVSVSYGFQE